MMRPDAEADEAGREHGQHDQPVTDELGARDGRDDHAHHAGGGQEDDVDLGMAEEPEQMLPEHRIAAARGIEEGPVERPLDLEQQGAEDDAGKGDDDHHREHQHRPGEDRHLVEAHARRARAQHPDDDLDRAGDRADLDKADAEQPEVGVDPGRKGFRRQRRIHEPAAVGASPTKIEAKKHRPPTA
jgi:hypothetical protein